MFTNIDGARTSCQVQRILQATTPTLTGEETEAQEDQGTCLHSLSPRWEPGFKLSWLSKASAFGHDGLLEE